MSARVVYSLSDNTSLYHHHNHHHNHHLHHLHHLHQDPSHNMSNAFIGVRPPCCAQAGAVFSLPVVVQLDTSDYSAKSHFFTMAVLLDQSTGAEAEGTLRGTAVVTGRQSTDYSAIFAFTDLSVAAAGTYKLRLDVYDGTDGATLVAQLETTEIIVQDGPVASQEPCKPFFPSFSSFSVAKTYC